MQNSKGVLKKAGVIPRLRLAVQKQGGGTESTGAHKVKAIEDKIVQGIDRNTGKEIYLMRYIFEENGEKKRYDVPVKDKQGDCHYLIERLAEVNEGEEITLEYVRKGLKGYIDVKRDHEDNEEDIDEFQPNPNQEISNAEQEPTDDLPYR